MIETKEIGIIGCGATGMATAVWYEKQGFRVTLCDMKDQFTDILLIQRQKGIWTEGAFGFQEPVPISKMSTDIMEAVKGKSYIIICVSAGRQEEIIQKIAPALEDGQIVLFSPGNLGSVYLRREINTIFGGGRKRKPDVIAAELSGNLWACRIIEAGKIIVALPLTTQKVAACPAADTEKAISLLRPLFQAESAKNVLEAVLNSPNLITHLAGTLLNMTEVEKKKEKFALFENGLSESVITVFQALEKERDAVLAAYGLKLYKEESCEVFMRKLMKDDTPKGLLAFRRLKGPSSMAHRYISEDAPCGIALLVSMAKKAGMNVPIAKSLLALAGAVNKTDYYKCGRTLDSMNFSEEELQG